MRRYRSLTEEHIYNALNRLRNAFLAAKDDSEVDQIIKGLLSLEERIQIGRRIIISECLNENFTLDEICNFMNVGKETINSVYKNMISYPDCYKLINNRRKKVEKEYEDKKYRKFGGPKLIHKRKEYTGFKIKDVKR